MVTNKNCVLRLSRYKNALYRFKALGFQKMFSDYLADSVGVTSAQVRKDFSLFGISGNKRGGYQIDALIAKLNDILGKNEIQKVIMVGAGHLGSALMKYKNFEKEGIRIIAAFDIDPSKVNAKAEIPVLAFSEMERFVQENNVKIGILAVPDLAAQQAAEAMRKAGIKGILNFAPIQVKLPEECIVSSVNLEVELENLIYFVTAMEKAVDLRMHS